jgi:hypothetical protein
VLEWNPWNILFEYEHSDESDGHLRSIVEKVDYTVSAAESGFYSDQCRF